MSVLFSVPVHEEIQVVEDLVQNILHFVGDDAKIVLHPNNYMHPLCMNLVLKYPGTVFVVPTPTEKRCFDISLWKAHMDVFAFAQSSLDFNFFVPFASNCMFVGPLDISHFQKYWKGEIPQQRVPSNAAVVNYNFDPLTEWLAWKSFERNGQLLDVFKQENIQPCNEALEGRIYTREKFNEIFEKMVQLDFCNLATDYPMQFEEILAPSLELHLFGFFAPTCCKIFWHHVDIRPLEVDILQLLSQEDSHICAVKRVFRNINDPVRKFIREKLWFPCQRLCALAWYFHSSQKQSQKAFDLLKEAWTLEKEKENEKENEFLEYERYHLMGIIAFYLPLEREWGIKGAMKAIWARGKDIDFTNLKYYTPHFLVPEVFEQQKK
jgi:hypothetical protein